MSDEQTRLGLASGELGDLIVELSQRTDAIVKRYNLPQLTDAFRELRLLHAMGLRLQALSHALLNPKDVGSDVPGGGAS